MIETERLKFRPFTADDLPWLIEMRSDPDVYRYLGGTKLQNPEALAKRIQFYIDCYEKFGFGSSVMIWKETGEQIGSAGLQPLEDTGEIEVGYNMKKAFWGRGIGTEAARGWLDHGFGPGGLERIVAIAIPENRASINIMEKLGMTYEKTEDHYGSQCAFYAVSREKYLALRNAKNPES
jgi:ribosomal-protein-alanine N-acetyltransferase